MEKLRFAATTANAVAGANVSGEVTFAATANAVAGANVSGTVATATTATTAGTITTAAQPNITSVGTLTVLGVNGIITAQSFTANTGLFTGDGGGLSNIAGGNVGLVANATYATSAGSSTLAVDVTGASQPNIASVATLLVHSSTDTVSASGSSQSDATLLTTEVNRVTSSSGTNGVKLPEAQGGLILFVTNATSSDLKVYPNTGDAINSLSTNIAFTHPGNATLQYVCTNATNWYTVGATYA